MIASISVNPECSARSFAKHCGVEEGIVFEQPAIAVSCKNDELGDPLLNRYHAPADEISPDTGRLWDSVTHRKLDKDHFRRDIGGVEEAYAEITKRMEVNLD